MKLLMASLLLATMGSTAFAGTDLTRHQGNYQDLKEEKIILDKDDFMKITASPKLQLIIDQVRAANPDLKDSSDAEIAQIIIDALSTPPQ